MTRTHDKHGRRGPAARPAAPATQRERPTREPDALDGVSTFDLTLAAPAQGGQMVARLDGQVTFLSGGIPGETVQAFIPTRKRGYLEGEARALLQPSADRVSPPCPYFGENGSRRGAIDQAAEAGPVCGGCQYQHIAYPRQLALKEEVVRDVLRRVGKIMDPPIAAPIPSPETYGYRNKASWMVTPEGELAYRAARSHTAVPIERCDLLTPALRTILHEVRDAAADVGLAGLAGGIEARVLPDPEGLERGTLLLELAHDTSTSEAHALGEALLDVCPSVVGVAGARKHEPAPATLAGEPRLRVPFLGETLIVSAGSFFQVNLAVATAMAEYVLGQCGTLAGREILDLYAGVGAFTVPLARRAEAVIAVEIDEGAVDDARAAIAQAALENVTLLPGDAAISLRALLPGAVSCAVLDPPRAGCTPEVLRQVVRSRSPRLIYVSCDAATLARDLRVLLDQGYELERVQPFDLFPQTAHVEIVVTLKLPRRYQAR
jgi:23S rRNA (uracil1939-C5)-methyltransferase